MIGKVIHSLLTNDSTVTTLVGANIFPIITPQGTAFPSVTYETVGTQSMEVLGWQKIADTIDIQLNIFAPTYTQAIDIKEAIKAVLDYKNGFVSEGLNFCGITPIDDLDGIYDEELNLFHRVLKYEFHLNNKYVL